MAIMCSMPVSTKNNKSNNNNIEYNIVGIINLYIAIIQKKVGKWVSVSLCLH